jgi:hypothetical protein
MKDNYDKLFEYLDHREPPAGLMNGVMLAISKEANRRVLWIRTVISGVLSLAAIVALIPSWLITQSESYQSGFSQFFSLLLSDTNSVMTFWKEFSLSLLESFPVGGTIAVLASVLVFLVSMRFFLRDIKRIRNNPKLVRA